MRSSALPPVSALTRLVLRGSPTCTDLAPATAQSSICTQSTATINSAADATQLASSCKTFNGDILVSTNAQGTVDFTGLDQVEGDFVAQNNGGLTTLSSSTLNSISGQFLLNNLTGLSTLAFTSLDTVGSIAWNALTSLDTLTFGTPGVQTAKSIVISDTFLSSLEGIDVMSLETLDINNNRRLVQWNSSLTNLSNTMNFLANGQSFQATFNQLTWIANMTINNVTSFEVPALQTVNGSASFGSNSFETFSAPNLTSTQVGDIDFVGNNNLKNISFPQLTTIGGALLIANNTAIDDIDGFPKLKTVNGAIKLRGNFSE